MPPRAVAPAIRTVVAETVASSPTSTATISPTDRAWPTASGGSARTSDRPRAVLQRQRHREQPAHRRVDAVKRAQPGDTGEVARAHEKQYESEEESPPSSRI